MCLFHPFLVYLLLFLALFCLLLSDLRTTLIPFFLNDLAIPVNLHEDVTTLVGVQLHDSLDIGIHHSIIVRHKVEGNILQERSLLLSP